MVQRGNQLGIRFDRLAFITDDDIALLHAGLFRTAPLGHALHHRADRQAVGLRGGVVQIAHRHAEIRPVFHVAVLLQVVDDIHDVVDGDGKADALDRRAGRGTAGVFGRRDTDDVAVHIKQRPTGVAGVDGSVGLHHVDGRAVGVDLAVQRADAAGGHGKRQFTQWVADGDDLLAHGQLVGVADRYCLQAAGLDLQQRHIVHGVRADDLRLVFLSVIELDGHGGRVLHDVVVGHDVAVLGEDKAAAGYAGRRRLSPDVGCDLGGDTDARVHVHGVDLAARERLIACIGRELFRQRRGYQRVAAHILLTLGHFRVRHGWLGGFFLLLGIPGRKITDYVRQNRTARARDDRHRQHQRHQLQRRVILFLLFGLLRFLRRLLRGGRLLLHWFEGIIHVFIVVFHNRSLL